MSAGRFTPCTGFVWMMTSDTAKLRMPPSSPTVRAAVPAPPSTTALPQGFVFSTTAVLPAVTSRMNRVRKHLPPGTLQFRPVCRSDNVPAQPEDAEKAGRADDGTAEIRVFGDAGLARPVVHRHVGDPVAGILEQG